MSGALFWSLGEAMRGFGAPEVEVRMAELGPGDSLEGGYRVLELLGEGAYGRVYRALDPQLGREVAVKVLTAGGPARERRFLREGRIAAALDHPSIGRVFSVGEHGTHPFLVYELLEGARDLRAAAPHWSRGQRLQALLQVADGVGHAHARGFVHRDLKPDNVVVDAGGRCRVIDFGLARDESDDGERLTASGALVGTPLYMAPEGFEQKHLGPAADVWSLGVILYWLLTDAHPFQAGSLLELGRRVTELDPTPPRELDASIPPALQAVCQRALERELDARYPDARAFAQALREALGEAPRSPVPGGAPRWPWALVGVAVLVAVAAFFGGGGPTPRTPTLEGAAAVEAALLAGEAERAHVLLGELPPSPERALLAARVARARGADPRPGLGAALRRWERPSLGLALARAELEAGDDLAARRALGGELERWPGDPEARALRGLLERLGEPRFDADRVELWREYAPRAVNAWLEVGCRRDLELWRWRRDPRQSERGQSTFEPEADLRERLKALARWADAPATLGFARAALELTGGPEAPPELDGELLRRVRAARALAAGRADDALPLTAAAGAARWEAWRLRQRGAALLALGQPEDARRALEASSARSPLHPETCRLLARAQRPGTHGWATYRALVEVLDRRSYAESEALLDALPPEVTPASRVVQLDAAIQQDPLSWHARLRRATIRGTDLDLEAFAQALEAQDWDPWLVRYLHDQVRTSSRSSRGVRELEQERSVGAVDYLAALLTQLEGDPPRTWREREVAACVMAWAVEVAELPEWFEPALAHAEAVLALHPEALSARLCRAFLLLRAARLDEADRELRRLEDWAPTCSLVPFYRALWLGASHAEPGVVRQALVRAKDLGFRGLVTRGFRVRLEDYPELAPYEGRISMRGLGEPQ